MPDRHKQKPILVTGSHRSGTTWVGTTIAYSNDVAYLHEPFNIAIRIRPGRLPLERWFQFVDEQIQDEYLEPVQELLAFKYPLRQNVALARSLRNVFKIGRDQTRFVVNRLRRRTPLIKDPVAFFSTEWLSRHFDLAVIVMIRHPAAFCSSLKLKEWRFDFNEFLRQPGLMAEYLHPFEKDIREQAHVERNIIEQGALLWNCIHLTIQGYQQRHPDWQFIRHEDLSQHPVEGFGAIYDKLHLDYTDRVREKVMRTSGSHNPSEQVARNEFIRNSRENITNWKRRLSENEINRIRDQTQEIARAFYGEHDW